MFVGFLVGILLMFGQKHILENDEHERNQEAEGAGGLALLDDTVFQEIETESSAAVLPAEVAGDENAEDGSKVGQSPKACDSAQTASVRGKPKLERGASEKRRQQAAIKIIGDMRAISAKVQDILRQPQGGSERDALDDELSELHMLLGVLRRHIRGAEPMTKQQFDAVVERTKVVEAVIARLEGMLQLPGVSVQAMDSALSRIEDELRRIIHANIDTVHKFRRWQASAPRVGRKTERIPWSLVVGVSVDCLVDGLLVGLTYTASHRAGYIMALATSIESCFLGLSLSSMISNATASRARHLLVSSIPVFTLLAGGAVAGLVGGTLDKGSPPFIGFIMFAIVSLLFLVTQELLLTAHSITDERAIWYININLFLGAGMVIFIEKLIPA